MSKLYSVPRGTKDILPEEIELWQYLEKNFQDCCRLFGYKEIRTPIFESSDLFIRTLGEETDIVEKEMYIFEDKSGRSLALRPEATAPVIRTVVEKSLFSKESLLRLYYIGPMFRYDRPQKGRYRQFHQVGVEAIGSSSFFLDGEVISLSCFFLSRIGLKNFNLQLNSVGCKICRKIYRENLRNFLENKIGNFCPDCQKRFIKNPLRILDCKNENCKRNIENSPKILDYLCESCKEHFENLKNYLDRIKIDYKINPYLVRGLDYYTKTTFEITSPFLGSQDAILGGGRYDYLVEEFGGPPLGAVGFAGGCERIINILSENREKILEKQKYVFIATLGKEAKFRGIEIANKLRSEKICTLISPEESSLKSQMRQANKYAEYVIIIGENEIEKNIYTLKNLNTGEQKEVKEEELIENIKF
jgi:histidyl-tRNA synthetase